MKLFVILFILKLYARVKIFKRRNSDKCRCECNEFINKCTCDGRFVWNSGICEYESDKSCYGGEYLEN